MLQNLLNRVTKESATRTSISREICFEAFDIPGDHDFLQWSRINGGPHCKDKRGSTSQKLCYDRNHNWVVAVIMLTGN